MSKRCECGYVFSGAGEFRREEAFISKDGKSGSICPRCGRKYVW